VSKDKREEEGESGTIMRSMEEGEEALWSKETVSQGSSDEHGRMDDKVEDCNSCRIQWIQLQVDQNSEEPGTRFPEKEAVMQYVV